MIKYKSVPGLAVRTDLSAGYWLCTGVEGDMDRMGRYYNPTAAVCYKPKYAPIFGGPMLSDADGGGD